MTFSPSQSVKYVTNEPRMGKNGPIISVAGKTTMEPFKCKSHMTYNEKRKTYIRKRSYGINQELGE